MGTVVRRGFIGEVLPRIEDERLVQGKGRFVGDLRFPGMLDLAILRSMYAHAAIETIDAQGAQAAGAVLALTGPQLRQEAPGLFAGDRPPIALDEVVYVGQGVALALAEDRYVAEDALEAVSVRYKPLPVIADAESAARAEPAAGHLFADVTTGFGEVEALIASADVVVEERLAIGRATAQPLEGRAILAAPEADGLTIYAATQGPHRLRSMISEILGIAPERVRVLAQDVGGGFGVKNGAYPEDVLACYLALRLGRPVRFIEDRREHFVSTQHARQQVHHVRLAARRDGTLLALDDELIADAGAFAARTPTGRTTAASMPGPYHLPAYRCRILSVRTHKVPIGPYRGAGRPEANFVMERMMDRLAAALGMDPLELRRRNLVSPEEMPYDTRIPARSGSGTIVYDSGDYPQALERAAELGGRALEQAKAALPPGDGRLVGAGLAVFVEDSGGPLFETGLSELMPDGRIRIATGSPSQGQGHETTYTQIACDALRQTPDRIVYGDTDTALVHSGIGTFGSRATAMAGSALHLACLDLAGMLRQRAASLLGEDPATLRIEPGRIEGSRQEITLEDLGRRLAEAGERLVARSEFRPEAPTYGDGAHVAICAVDPRTGKVEILRYVAVDDCGNIISPQLVDGQIQGGVAFGVSTALLEELIYDEEGQLLTGSFMDYLLPTMHDVPTVEIEHLCSPSPRNPLGVKGVGEGGTIPALAAIARAVEDALSPFGAVVRQLPLTPERVRRLAAGESTDLPD